MLSHHSAAANITWSGVTNTLLLLFVLLVTMLIISTAVIDHLSFPD